MQLHDTQIIPSGFQKWRQVFDKSFPSLEKYSDIYKDLHQHPELPTQESRTASVVANHLEALGYAVQRNIGGHGVVGILTSPADGGGKGKTVLLRSELDALPLQENTGLPYASKVRQLDPSDGMTKPVMHGCGHDMHMASLLGAADLLARTQHLWHGTLICLFQPNEERLLGARAMIEEGKLFDKMPMPDILLAQHAVPTRAGTIGTRPGRVLGYLDSLAVRVYGKGTHSSTPELGVDPILMAACIVSRLQLVVSREIDFTEPCVITCGYLHAGTDASIIPEHADFTVDVRSFSGEVQRKAVAATKRIIEAECQAANSPRAPRIVTSASCPPIDNDKAATERFTGALRLFYGHDEAANKVIEMDLDITADDFVLLAHPPADEGATTKPIPYVYWNYGVTPRDEYDQAVKDGTLRDLPFNHNPRFAAEIEPSLRAGIEGLAVAAVAFFES